MISHTLASVATSKTASDCSHYAPLAFGSLGSVGVVRGIGILVALLLVLGIGVLVALLAVLWLWGGAVALDLALLRGWGSTARSVSRWYYRLQMGMLTGKRHVLGGYWRHTGRRTVRIGRAESRPAGVGRRSLRVLVGHSLVGHLHTEVLEELDHSLVGRTALEVGSLAGCSPEENIGCMGLTLCTISPKTVGGCVEID